MKSGGGENISFAEQDVAVMKWSILWRTIILSALGKTMYPYCRHLRELDLKDLSFLLDRINDSPKYRSKVAKQFFSGHLERFHFTSQARNKSRTVAKAVMLDIKSILLAVGDEITKQSPLIEALSEPSTSDVLITALPIWTPRLEHLRELEFWDGKLLADETVRDLLHAHCPNLARLQLYTSTNSDSDHCLAMFIGGLQPNTLVSFENNSSCGISTETMLALNSHGERLSSLKLGLEEDGMLALGLLKDCVALETLHVSSLRPSVDLKATQNDVYADIVEWLKGCNRLKEVTFNDVVSAPDLLLPILNNANVSLKSLTVKAKEDALYIVKDHHDFHKALKQQKKLESLLLHADADPVSRDDIEVLMDTLTALESLNFLKLVRLSDYFSNEQVNTLAQSLHRLETLYIGGYGISDAVLPPVACMESLKTVTFAGITAFTVDGLLDFVDCLPANHVGFQLSIEAAVPETMLSEEGQDLVKDALATKMDGRFEYMPLRGRIQTPEVASHQLIVCRPKCARIR